jgi:hypothetical protein
MTDVKESSSKENEIIEEFPYPKLIKLFDFYFPKTEGHEKIDWRKILRIWSRWAPWITVVLLILISCFTLQENTVAFFAVFSLFGCILNFAYYLVLAVFAKLVKRSPRVLLALTPRVPLAVILMLCIMQLLFGSENRGRSDASKRDNKATEASSHPNRDKKPDSSPNNAARKP